MRGGRAATGPSPGSVTGSGNCDTAPHPASVLFSYASSGSQGRSWTKWCNGQYPGHFRGLGRQGSGPESRKLLSCTPTAGLGVQPSVHTWATFSFPPLGESLQSLIMAWDLIQISVQDTNTWLSWFQRQPCHPLGLDVTLYKTRMLRKTAGAASGMMSNTPSSLVPGPKWTPRAQGECLSLLSQAWT